MAQTTPLWGPAESISLAISASVIGGRLLEISGSNTVAHAGAGSTKWIGVAAYDVTFSSSVTRYVEIRRGWVESLLAAANVTAGDLVMCAASGQVTPIAAAGGTYAAADITNTRARVGLALETFASGASGAVATFD